MAYREEPEVKTTLLEGSVELLSGNLNTRLQPGQQAQLEKGFFRLIKNPNIDEVMAWKKGEFHFKDTKLQTIMRQVERWYDVSIVYKGNLADIRLSGIISQKKDVSQLLEILEATHQVKCSLQGNTIVVAPY
jgi:ferric-dicitrate binding protein FerR (iron transport regulator)